MPNKFAVPSHCNDKAGRKEPLKNGVSQMGQNKPMGEKMSMKARSSRSACSTPARLP